MKCGKLKPLSPIYGFNPLSEENIGRAIGRIASGVYIVTLTDAGQPEGMLTTWIGQTSFEPAMISVVVKKERALLSSLTVGRPFTVNVLSKKNMDIFKNFAKPHSDGLNRFDGLNFEDSLSGAIFSDCVAYMTCKVKTLVEAGDHHLVLSEITAGDVLNGDDEPMVHLRKNGFQY